MNFIDMLRHHLATLALRAQHAISDAPPSYPEFEAGNGVLKPVEILNHINLMIVATRQVYLGEKLNYPEDVPWEQATERFHSSLAELDQAFAKADPLDDDRIRRLYQGPWSDAMTHVGQLIMLRRLAGSPVRRLHYMKSDVRAGHLGPDQTLDYSLE